MRLSEPNRKRCLKVNILHWKYAIEVERTRSINRAAENLFMGQPNLSRAIKELEESLGITIFKRTSKGMSPTPQGEEFLQHAKRILSQIEEVEALYNTNCGDRVRFSVSVPRASYIACAFTNFLTELDSLENRGPMEIYYKETNAIRAIDNLLQADYRLGIIRYQRKFEQYFQAMLHDKGISSQVIAEFTHVALMSANHPLAARSDLDIGDFRPYTEIAHADPFVPSLPAVDARKAEMTENVEKHIYVFERSSQMDLLSRVPHTFMWVSPVPQHLLNQYGLVQKTCPSGQKVYKDVLIHRQGYRLTENDEKFVSAVCRMRDTVMTFGNKTSKDISI